MPSMHCSRGDDMRARRHQVGHRAAVARALDHEIRDQRDRLGVVQLDAARQPPARHHRGKADQQLVLFAGGQVHRHPHICQTRGKGGPRNTFSTAATARLTGRRSGPAMRTTSLPFHADAAASTALGQCGADGAKRIFGAARHQRDRRDGARAAKRRPGPRQGRIGQPQRLDQHRQAVPRHLAQVVESAGAPASRPSRRGPARPSRPAPAAHRPPARPASAATASNGRTGSSPAAASPARRPAPTVSATSICARPGRLA